MYKIGKKEVKSLVRKKYPKVKFDDSLEVVFKKFNKTDLNIIPVFRDKKFMGEIHEIDLLKVVVNPEKVPREEIVELGFGVDFGYFAKQASDIMTTHELSVNSSDLVEDAVYTMLKEKVRCLPVFYNKKFTGILTEQDLIKEIVKEFV